MFIRYSRVHILITFSFEQYYYYYYLTFACQGVYLILSSFSPDDGRSHLVSQFKSVFYKKEKLSLLSAVKVFLDDRKLRSLIVVQQAE